jgi:formamidopyrimidine-DNA glycosylase
VVRRSLEPGLLGRRLRGVQVGFPQLREPVPQASLEALVGRSIVGLRRRAKYLLLDLSGSATVVIHLGMSGRLTLVSSASPRELHEHVALGLSGGDRLRLVDPRRFGLVLVLPTAGLEDDRHFRRLGLEPLGDRFGGAALRAAAARRRVSVKTFLMDSRAVVGVGNIYASEALHRASIHPRRSVARLGGRRWEVLAEAVRRVLSAAIEQGGTTLADFVDGAGQQGWFQVSLAVYDREGEPCRSCGSAIRRLVQAGRSTFYCPHCQT